MLKNSDVIQEDFSNLWIVSKLFDFNDWSEIARTLKDYFQSEIIGNPLFAKNA